MRNAPEFASPSIPRRFGRFELRPGERVLLADGAPVAIGARAFDLLAAFVDRPGDADHEGRSPRHRMAGPRRGGEQPAGAGVDAAQDPRAERARHDPGARLSIQPGRSVGDGAPRAARRQSRACARRGRRNARDRRRAPTCLRACRCSTAARTILRRSQRCCASIRWSRSRAAGGIGKTRVAQAVAQIES